MDPGSSDGLTKMQADKGNHHEEQGSRDADRCCFFLCCYLFASFLRCLFSNLVTKCLFSNLVTKKHGPDTRFFWYLIGPIADIPFGPPNTLPLGQVGVFDKEKITDAISFQGQGHLLVFGQMCVVQDRKEEVETTLVL